MKTTPLLILVLFTLSAWGGCSRETNSTPPPAPARAGSESVGVAAPRFTTIRVDARTERIELFLRDDAWHAFKSFDRLSLTAHSNGARVI